MSILADFRRDEQRILDRLVDGELSQSDRRELLAALDDEPGAWRRCALTFLESQTWHWQLTRLAADATLAAPLASNEPPSGAVWTVHRRAAWASALAIAASLLVAFGMGTLVPMRSPREIAQQPPVQTDQIARDASSFDDDESLWGAFDEPRSVTLALADEGTGAGSIELAIADASQDDETWLEQLESGVPANLLDQLRQSGFEVVRQQRLFPVEMSDGRKLVVPVEQVDIRAPASAESL